MTAVPECVKSDTMTKDATVNADGYSFGAPVRMVWDDTAPGCLRRQTWTERLRELLTEALAALTQWFRPRAVVSAVDVESGTVTLATEHWSWTCRRWER